MNLWLFSDPSFHSKKGHLQFYFSQTYIRCHLRYFSTLAIKPHSILISWISLGASRKFFGTSQSGNNLSNFWQKLSNYQQSQLSYVSVICSVSRFLAHSLKFVSFFKFFKELFLNCKVSKKFFVTSETIHEVQIFSGLMAKVEKKS